MCEFTDLDQVWLVVTPQNPLKQKKSLLADFHRLALVKEAIDDNRRLRVILNLNAKAKLHCPYIAHLIENHPENDFAYYGRR